MQRYRCPSCQELTEASGARYAWCGACGQPLTLFDLLLVEPGSPAAADTGTPDGSCVPGGQA